MAQEPKYKLIEEEALRDLMLVDECRHGLQTHAVAEVKIHLAVGHRLNPVSDTQPFQPLGEQRSAGAAHRADVDICNLLRDSLLGPNGVLWHVPMLHFSFSPINHGM